MAAIAVGCGPAARAGLARVTDYRPVFEACRGAGGGAVLAIRRMAIDGEGFVLAVDPDSLVTRLAPAVEVQCAKTSDARQKDTRYLRAVAAADSGPLAVVANGGLLRGTAGGTFMTGDLCPSRRGLDRGFLERLAAVQPGVPVALAISGTWLLRHEADFEWLRARARDGGLRITWVDHSYDHPYVPGRAFARNFLLSPGVDMRAEILNTERLLVAHGQTPSVFFRFPGLVSDASLMRVAGEFHLIVLGAGAWLAKSGQARAGDVVLVHLNGNEPAGLRIFSVLLGAGRMPRPFRAIEEAP